MKKISVLLIMLVALTGCGGNSDTTESSATSSTTAVKASSTVKSSTAASSETTTTTVSESTIAGPLAGYSDEQVEYARVVITVSKANGIDRLPIEISVTKNPAGHQVLPFDGAVTLAEASVTISASYDGTMAGTFIFTYISNHDGSITYYKLPNHYQDERYTTDPEWVKTETQKMVDNRQYLVIPTSNDDAAVQIIELIDM